ncbi:hypothetical protein electrica_04584 [Klebsiella electrica]|nr:hypothetical protein electrica_04584 [Klebsiella electrica]
MLKRLKLKSLLPSSALRSNSAALRLSKTPPQGGVFAYGPEPSPGWRLTPYPGYNSPTGDKARHRTRVAPVSTAPPGSKRRQCHRPARRQCARRSSQTPHHARSPGKHSATGEQTAPVPQARPQAIRQAIKPDTAPTRSPGKHSAIGEQTAPVPQARPQAIRQVKIPNTAPTRSPGKRSATGEQTAPVPQAPRGQYARR